MRTWRGWQRGKHRQDRARQVMWGQTGEAGPGLPAEVSRGSAEVTLPPALRLMGMWGAERTAPVCQAGDREAEGQAGRERGRRAR